MTEAEFETHLSRVDGVVTIQRLSGVIAVAINPVPDRRAGLPGIVVTMYRAERVLEGFMPFNCLAEMKGEIDMLEEVAPC